MKFAIYQESRQGPRKSNQDRVVYCYTRDALCMIIADGMGGHLHGEVAAQIATQFIGEAFQRAAQPRLADPFKFLLESITNAHHAIVDYANVRSLLETPRTTVVACVVQEGLAHWAHVGDSRLYLIRNGRVEFYALRAIAAGQEITVDYGPTHHEGRLACRCGAPGCRGAL